MFQGYIYILLMKEKPYIYGKEFLEWTAILT